MTYQIRSIAPDGSHAKMLPDVDSVQVSVAFSDVGSIQFDYAVNGAHADVVADQLEVAVLDEGVEIVDTRSVLEGGNGQRVAPEGVTYRSWSGRNLWKMLGEALVYATDWPADAGDGTRSFASATPGTILATLISKAQALGELTGVTYDFTSAVDSNGVPWTMQLSIQYEMGVSILQVVQNLVDQGTVEIRMNGRVVQAYNPDSLGTDRTLGSAPVVLWAGRNATEAPEQTNSADLRTVALVKGDNGVFREIVDATGVAKYGRRTLFVSQGGVSDDGTLAVIGQTNLDKVNRVRSELTYKYVPGGDDNLSGLGFGEGGFGDEPFGGASQNVPIPMRDFFPGDWVYTDITGTMQRVRVRQVMIEWGADSGPTYTLVLNDKFMERDILLARRVQGITGGATAGGGSSALPVEPSVDYTKPSPPTGMIATSDAFVDDQGHTFAQISANWLAPTTNVDGTVLEDLDHYEIQWWYNSEALKKLGGLVTTDESISWSPVKPGENVSMSVVAVDRSGNRSEPSNVYTLVTGADTTPPPVPSAPVVTTPFAGMVRISWDGLGSAGEAMPPDFKWVEVHWSAVNDFVPDATTLHDTLVGAMLSNATGIPYDQPIYVKFVSVDLSDNKSEPSAQGSATPVKIGVDDVGFTAVDIGGGTFHTYIGATDPDTDPDTVLQEGEIWIDTGNDNEPKRWDAAAGAWTSFRDQVEITEGRIAAGAVTAAKIAAGAITAGSAIIADAAISSAQIASLSAGKITAGTLVADITVSSRIKTADSGARTEMNSLGLYTYDSSNDPIIIIDSSGFKAYNNVGQLMVDISASGSGATITGSFKTAFAGGRTEILSWGSGDSQKIQMYDENGYVTTIAQGVNGSINISGNAGQLSYGTTGFSVSGDYGDSYIRSSESFGLDIKPSLYSTVLHLGNALSYPGSVFFGTLNVSAGANLNGGNVTIDSSYRLNTERIEAVSSGILRLEPSIRVVSTPVYTNTSSGAANVYVTSAGSLYRSTSSERYKVNVDRTWGERAPLEAIKKLTPASYWDKGDAERLAHQLDTYGPLKEGEDEYDPPRQFVGLIAEDVEALGITDLVVYDLDGRPDGVMYERLAVAMLPWLHELESRMEALERK